MKKKEEKRKILREQSHNEIHQRVHRRIQTDKVTDKRRKRKQIYSTTLPEGERGEGSEAKLGRGNQVRVSCSGTPVEKGKIGKKRGGMDRQRKANGGKGREI